MEILEQGKGMEGHTEYPRRVSWGKISCRDLYESCKATLGAETVVRQFRSAGTGCDGADYSIEEVTTPESVSNYVQSFARASDAALDPDDTTLYLKQLADQLE